MRDYQITCPYCFEQFSHTKVHFRMETFFEEGELNDEGLMENEIKRMPESERKNNLMNQLRKRQPFLRGKDEKYEAFWGNFGGTTELTTGVDKKMIEVVQELPVLNPEDKAAQEVLKMKNAPASGTGKTAANYFMYDGDGMVVAVEDIYDRDTHRRVCPHCHNPLPLGYGKHPLKFISVIGVTGAGKTVYISQLLKGMNKYASLVSMDAYFTSDHETNFIENNPVEINKPLPRPTMDGQLAQPMFYDLVQSVGNDQIRTNTIVIYDIAGENCKTAGAMQKYGEFVLKSDGIILLVDPSQLELVVEGRLGDNVRSAEPALVLNTIHSAFVAKNSQKKQDIPMAVCISKSDSFDELLPMIAKSDVTPVVDSFTEEHLPKFNASEYNVLEPEIRKLMQNNPMVTNLKNGYNNFNFFVFSATGCGVENRMEAGDTKPRSYPVAPPVPKRIAEPLLWLFYKFGYIGSDVPIRLPFPRPMPEGIPVPPSGLKKLFGGKPEMRPLTEEEKERYRYEERC